MKPSDFDILELIPQRPPMQMVDKLLQADERSAIASLTVKDSNLFCENGKFREPGLIEFIAQTAAAFTGYRNKLHSGKVNEGYIGAVKNLIVTTLPPVDSEIQCKITVENEIVGFTIITGKVMHEGNVVAECEMRILER
jgi:predicted hotdog family 3-hydroxylacyl-ACP dehydratase